MSALPANISEQAGDIVTRAVIRYAQDMSLSGARLSRIIGLSEATVSRMKAGKTEISVPSKHSELAFLFIRIGMTLSDLAGKDKEKIRAWMRKRDEELRGRPIDMVESITGLVKVVEILEARAGTRAE